MEVLDKRATILTNVEVLELLKEAKTKVAKPKQGGSRQYNTILYEAMKYLGETPAAVQTPAHVKKLVKALEKFKLTGAEAMQIANLRPTKPIEVQLVIEECEERLTEEQVEQLCQIVAEILPEPLKPEPSPDEEGEA
ncbi:Calcitonin gene-related peptide-receptor component protein [Aphelenchoides avenae]|nr:Calcitonin gene-related peptide-receptor component protein [Aphelenchus avenae]